MANATVTRGRCRIALHGYGVFDLNGQRFTEAVYSEGNAQRLAEEALRDWRKARPRARVEVRKAHLEYGRWWSCEVVL